MTAGDRQILALCCLPGRSTRKRMAVLAAEGTTYETATQSGTMLYRPRPEARTRVRCMAPALRWPGPARPDAAQPGTVEAVR